jgi:hypothetical protein
MPLQDVSISSELIQTAIQESLPMILKEKLSSSYSSPISKVVDEALKENDGSIRVFVSKVIADALSDTKFKDELAKLVLAKVIESGLRNK